MQLLFQNSNALIPLHLTGVGKVESTEPCKEKYVLSFRGPISPLPLLDLRPLKPSQCPLHRFYLVSQPPESPYSNPSHSNPRKAQMKPVIFLLRKKNVMASKYSSALPDMEDIYNLVPIYLLSFISLTHLIPLNLTANGAHTSATPLHL